MAVMRLPSSRPARLSLLLTLVLLALLLWDTRALLQLQRTNAAIRAPQSQALPEQAPLALVHAEALRRAHDGRVREAHDLLARVAMHAPAALAQRAEYNHANLLLREAIDLRNAGDEARTIAIAELAKESYRRVLRQAPEHWDARYNLERTLRLVPDPPEIDAGEGAAPLQRERAPTTMRGDTLGLP